MTTASLFHDLISDHHRKKFNEIIFLRHIHTTGTRKMATWSCHQKQCDAKIINENQ